MKSAGHGVADIELGEAGAAEAVVFNEELGTSDVPLELGEEVGEPVRVIPVVNAEGSVITPESDDEHPDISTPTAITTPIAVILRLRPLTSPSFLFVGVGPARRLPSVQGR